ncbi:hypothetical protein Tco_0323596 [Tanacetum coccineum]
MYVNLIVHHIFTTVIPQSLPSFTPPPPQSTPTLPPKIEGTNPPFALPDFASVFQFINRVSALEKDVSELKKDILLKLKITEQVKNQLPHILPKEVSNFSPPVIQSMVTESLKHAVLAKESSQPQSSYEAAASLI